MLDVATETTGKAPFPGAAHKKAGRCQVCQEDQDVELGPETVSRKQDH